MNSWVGDEQAVPLLAEGHPIDNLGRFTTSDTVDIEVNADFYCSVGIHIAG
jgi:hypothetical protein